MDEDKLLDRPSFKPVEETEEDLCRAMWLAVLVQAILDATGKSGNALDEAKAKEWLKGHGGVTSNLSAVCDLAGVDFETTRKRFESLLASKSEKIDFRCMKKAHLKNRSLEGRKRYFRRANNNARIRRERIRKTQFEKVLRENCTYANDNFNQPTMENMNEQQTSTNLSSGWDQSNCVVQSI